MLRVCISMTSVCVVVLSVSASLLSAAAIRPIEADLIRKKDGTAKPVWIFSEKLAKIELARNGDATESESSIDWNKVRRVTYTGNWQGVDYPRALRAYNKGDFAQASELLSSALDGRYEKLRIEAAVLLSKSLVHEKKYDEAIASLKTVLANYSQWRFLHQVQSRIGEIQLFKKDIAAARLQLAALKGMTAWGARATAKAAILEAHILQAEKKDTDAIAVLNAAIAGLNSDDAGTEKCDIAIALMELQAKAKDYAGVLKTGAVAEWVPSTDPNISASIHVKMAEAYLELDDSSKAFYQCALAASIPGANGVHASKARKIARGIVSLMKKAEEPNKKLIKKYTKTLSKF